MSSIEQKIKSLFNLAAENSNATEAEAKTALNLAFKLMAKYNVSKENLEESLLEKIIELNYPLTNQMIFKGC